MSKGSNCALVHELNRLEFTSGVYLKQNYCYKCANDMLAIHYIGDIQNDNNSVLNTLVNRFIFMN